MADVIKLQMLPVIISIIEVGMCYQFLYCTVLEKGYRNGQRVLVWVNILLLGSLLGINRGSVFFSNLMLVICIIISIAFVGYIIRKGILMTASLICIFYTSVGLIDFLIAFVSMIAFQNSFFQVVYLNADFQWKSTIYFLSRVIVGVFIWLISRKKESIKRNLLEYKKIIILGSITLWFILIYYQKLLDDMALGIQNMQGGKGAFSLVCVLTLIGMAASMIFKYQAICREHDIIVLKEQMLEYNYQELREALEDKKILIHDMKNHLLIVENHLKNLEYSKAEAYLSELAGGLGYMVGRDWTGNRTLDFIINYKKQEAEQSGIKMYIEGNALPSLPFSDNELCSLFSNLLDNSIEACRKIKEGRKDIYLTLRYQKQMLFIECRNTCCESPHMKQGRPVTTKKDKEIHGYGIKSMERMVNYYEGKMTYCVRDGTFTVKISFFDLHYN